MFWGIFTRCHRHPLTLSHPSGLITSHAPLPSAQPINRTPPPHGASAKLPNIQIMYANYCWLLLINDSFWPHLWGKQPTALSHQYGPDTCLMNSSLFIEINGCFHVHGNEQSHGTKPKELSVVGFFEVKNRNQHIARPNSLKHKQTNHGINNNSLYAHLRVFQVHAVRSECWPPPLRPQTAVAPSPPIFNRLQRAACVQPNQTETIPVWHAGERPRQHINVTTISQDGLY